MRERNQGNEEVWAEGVNKRRREGETWGGNERRFGGKGGRRK